MQKSAKIYIAGHGGLIRGAIENLLRADGYSNILIRTRQELDLLRQSDAESFFKAERPQYVFLPSARAGGIKANISYPAQFIYENIAIQTNVIHSAYLFGVKKLMFFASACIYPRLCPQPMKEKQILTGYLEPTNEPYAIAKIAGIKMCQAYNRQYGTNFICPVVANVYGPNDDFDLQTSHVIPALISRFHEAKINNSKSVMIWGSGKPRREFIYVDDLAQACLLLMNNYEADGIINVGAGKDLSIRELATLVKNIVGFKGRIVFDKSKPDGMFRKLLDNSRIKKLGWKAETSLEEGIRKTYSWYKDVKNFKAQKGAKYRK